MSRGSATIDRDGSKHQLLTKLFVGAWALFAAAVMFVSIVPATILKNYA